MGTVIRNLAVLAAVVIGFQVIGAGSAFAQNVCAEGQSLLPNRAAGTPGCSCRPPMKFLPGNICGTGQPTRARPAGSGDVAPQRVCQPGQVPEAQGCVCQSPLVVLPGGRCNRPTVAGAKCLEGQNIAQARCQCTRPLIASTQGLCIRCLPGDGDRVVNGQCVVAAPNPRR